jgi:hypothetical protein
MSQQSSSSKRRPGPMPARGERAAARARRAPAAEEPLDTIPMHKTGWGTIIGVLAVALVVGGVAAYSLMGGKKRSSKDVEQLKVQALQSARPEQDLSVTEQRQHIAISRRAMKQVESEEQQKQAEQGAKQAAETESTEQKAAAAKPKTAVPATGAKAKKAASSLEAIGDDIATQLGGQ